MADKTRLHPPGYTYLDNSGNALASGKIYTYIEGTTTNKTTYTDQAGGTANANPVVLDSNGRAAIWLDVDEGYKIVVKTSADVTLTTTDTVFGIPNDDLQMADSDGIFDENGNEQLIFQTTASATNYLEVTNAATTTAPALGANGSDSNIDINLTPLGTGNVNISIGALELAGNEVLVEATATQQGEVRLYEDTDNGTNYMGFKAPAAVTTSLSLTLPNGDGTSGQYLSTNAAGVLSWTSVVAQAAQANIEAETNENTYIPPDLLKHSPGVAKVWCLYTEITTTAITASYNVTSVTDLATGYTSVNYTTALSSADHVVIASAGNGDAKKLFATPNSSSSGIAVGNVRIQHTQYEASNTDCVFGTMAAFGDFA